MFRDFQQTHDRCLMSEWKWAETDLGILIKEIKGWAESSQKTVPPLQNRLRVKLTSQHFILLAIYYI